MLLHVYSHPDLDGYQRHFVVFPYREIPKDEIRTWCHEQFGEASPRYKPKLDTAYRWKDDINMGEIEFANEADMAFFVLRWGGDH